MGFVCCGLSFDGWFGYGSSVNCGLCAFALIVLPWCLIEVRFEVGLLGGLCCVCFCFAV